MKLKGKNHNDTWRLDNALSPIIAERLKKLREVVMECDTHCYPAVFELSQESKDVLDRDREYYDKVSKDLWLSAIDKMIYAFDSEEPEAHDKVHEIKCDDGRELFARYYNHLWW